MRTESTKTIACTTRGRAKNEEIYQPHFENFQLAIVPPKATSHAQPLDVYFNYWWKYIARRMADYVMLNEINVNLAERRIYSVNSH